MNQDYYVVIEHLQGKVLDISYVMLAAARKLAQSADGEVIAVLLGHKAQELANDLGADLLKYFDHPALEEFTPDAYLNVLETLINDDPPRVMLMGHSSIGMDVASGLSARLDLPLVSQCQSVSVEDGGLQFVCQTCGGKIMAEGFLPESTTLVTMVPGGYKPDQGQSDQPPKVTKAPVPDLDDLRIKLKQYIEPEAGDVDISKEEVLISVGRGLQNQDDLELAEELAQALGGSVCASRPIVDQGWLPITRLVGKSGLKVKPKLYLVFGISGAPEHVESIIDSEMIIAVNTDTNAPIFDIANFGVEVDMYDLLPALLEKIQQG